MKWVQDSVQPMPCPRKRFGRVNVVAAPFPRSHCGPAVVRGALAALLGKRQGAVPPALSLAVTLFSVLLP